VSVPCRYPEQDDRRFPPEGWDEWKTAETCDHEYCIEAAQAFASWPAERSYRESVQLAAEDGFTTNDAIYLGLK
jgi:hypothetical protein